jgi:uncharacterized membrane protein
VDTPPVRIEIRPNCALSVRAARRFFVLACIPPAAIAGYLTWRGFWPVLPFAGAELALLGWALHGSMQRRFHAQSITLTEANVSIETRLRGQCAQVEFPALGAG